MEKKFVVVDGQTFISAAAVHDFVSAPIEAVEPEQGAIGVTSLFVDGLQSVAKTNVGKPRIWIHADGRVEINEDVDWTNAESVLSFIRGMVSETELGASLAKVSSGVFAALDAKPAPAEDPYSPKIIWRGRIGDTPARDPIEEDVQDGRAEYVLSGPYRLSEGGKIEVTGGKVKWSGGAPRSAPMA